jgi:DNA-directed RNA polymerase subunit RPC12/RpoP
LERKLNTLELNEENEIVIEAQDNAVCDVCGEEFKHPLLAELVSGDHTEEYYACPRCLTKVGEVERQEKIEVDEDDGEEEEGEVVEEVQQENETAKSADAPPCPYYLGYLKKRQKNSPIPETCLICSKMIECMR